MDKADRRCVPRPVRCTLSRKRYDHVRAELETTGFSRDAIESILDILCRALNFDPSDKTPSERQKEYVHRKAKELGVSTYEAGGAKRCYHRKREALGKRNELKEIVDVNITNSGNGAVRAAA